MNGDLSRADEHDVTCMFAHGLTHRYFNVLAGRLAGVWLDSSFQLGANVCLIGLYNAAVLTAERSLCFLINTQFGEAIEEFAAQPSGSASGRLLRSLLNDKQTGVAPLYILTNAAVAVRAATAAAAANTAAAAEAATIPFVPSPRVARASLWCPRLTPRLATRQAVLVWMPYTLLVEFSMLIMVPSILLFMWSFVALRIQRPYVERPFLIPGGLPVAVLLTVVRACQPCHPALLWPGLGGDVYSPWLTIGATHHSPHVDSTRHHHSPP